VPVARIASRSVRSRSRTPDLGDDLAINDEPRDVGLDVDPQHVPRGLLVGPGHDVGGVRPVDEAGGLAGVAPFDPHAAVPSAPSGRSIYHTPTESRPSFGSRLYKAPVAEWDPHVRGSHTVSCWRSGG